MVTSKRGRRTPLLLCLCAAFAACSTPGAVPVVDAGVVDAGPSCWEETPLEPPAECRDLIAIQTEACLEKSFPTLANAALASFQRVYSDHHGKKIGQEELRPATALGFFIDKRGIFMEVVHTEVRCLLEQRVTREYLAGRDGPPVNCGDRELLYVGKAAEVLADPNSSKYQCFDCVALAELADIVVGRFVDPATVPTDIAVVTLAYEPPPIGSNVIALGKPFGTPFNRGEARSSLGRVQAVIGNSVLASNIGLNGFSAGPMLDGCGRARAVAVTRVGDLQFARPHEWQPSWTIGVVFGPLANEIRGAIAYADVHAPPGNADAGDAAP